MHAVQWERGRGERQKEDNTGGSVQRGWAARESAVIRPYELQEDHIARGAVGCAMRFELEAHGAGAQHRGSGMDAAMRGGEVDRIARTNHLRAQVLASLGA